MKKIISILLTLTVLLLTVVPCSAGADAAPVTMKIEGFKSREVLSFSYGFNRPTGIEGELAGIPRSTSFTIRVPGLSDGNNDLFTWALAGGAMPKNLMLEFVNPVDESSIKTIKLTNAYCVSYTEYWDQDGTYYEEIEIVSKEFQNGPAEYENPWD